MTCELIMGYENLKSLREMVGFEDTEAPTTSAQGISDEMAGFSIIVVEERGQLSRATRLANVLHGVSSLYDAHAHLLSLPTDALLVKAFDFLGIARAIEALKETIVSLWDRVVFFRERKMHVNIRLVAESLPVLAQISALAEQNAIAPEQAELLRRQVIDGATQLVEAGAILPETTRGGKAEIRSLVAPETRLLVAPDECSSKSPAKRQGIERRRRKGQRK